MQDMSVSSDVCGDYKSHEQFAAELPEPDCGRGSLLTAVPCPTCGADLSWRPPSGAASVVALALAGLPFAYPWTARYHCPKCGLVDERTLSPRLRMVTLARKLLLTAAGVAAVGGALWAVSAVA